MSLANILGRLSRSKMKGIMAGSEEGGGVSCVCSDDTQVETSNCQNCYTYCNTTARGGISCSAGDCTRWPNG